MSVINALMLIMYLLLGKDYCNGDGAGPQRGFRE